MFDIVLNAPMIMSVPFEIDLYLITIFSEWLCEKQTMQLRKNHNIPQNLVVTD